MFDFKKILASQGIDLDKLQAEAEKVPKLLEALVSASNAQTRAIKEQSKAIEELYKRFEKKS